jgi:hypothetical protein
MPPVTSLVYDINRELLKVNKSIEFMLDQFSSEETRESALAYEVQITEGSSAFKGGYYACIDKCPF